MPYLGGMTTTGQAATSAVERVAHTYITHITEARTAEHARAIAAKIRPSVLAIMADLLYIDGEAHGVKWLRDAIVTEARA